ncbi:hypothetical protein C240_2946 [Enterococcus sp. 5H]|nr:hypothetical protein [Enterococcus sp. 5H]
MNGENEKKIMFQLSKMVGLSLSLLVMPVVVIITMIVMSFVKDRDIFQELSFIMWVIITICQWIAAIIIFKQTDLKFVSKKDLDI